MQPTTGFMNLCFSPELRVAVKAFLRQPANETHFNEIAKSILTDEIKVHITQHN